MDTVILPQITQHKDLKRELLSTGNAELIEVRTACMIRVIAVCLRISVELGQRRILGAVGRMEEEKRAWEGS